MRLANWRRRVLFTTITELALHTPGLIECLFIEPDTKISPFRWATHGARTQENAHPHHDHENRIAIVHNGVIENATELRQELGEKYGVKCRYSIDDSILI